MKKALFLDRDGVIIKMHYHEDSGIIETPLSLEQVEFQHGIFDLLHLAKKLGYLLILVSNQPGVGIKKISLIIHNQIKDYIAQKLQDEGVPLDGQYYCLHHPYAQIAEYKKECECRKPKIGLLVQAIEEFDIDPKKSWMIGDGVNDIISGSNIGCKTILIGNIYEAEYLSILEKELGNIKPNFLVKKIEQIDGLISK